MAYLADHYMGLGDDAVRDRSPMVTLVAQVNRFTRAGQFGGVVYPIDVASGNPLTVAAARTAVIIHQTRLLTAQAGITDTSTASQIAAAAKGLADPVGYVTANLAAITGSIQGYADMKGLPVASYAIDQTKAPSSGLSITTIVLIGGSLAALWLIGRKP